MSRAWAPALMLVALACARGGPASRLVTGTVVDAQGRPVAAARVRLQATALSTETTEQGTFALRLPAGVDSGVLAAAADGFYNGGQPLAAGRGDYRVALEALPSGDHPGYAWRSPRRKAAVPGEPADSRKACQECHPALVAEWAGSAHATSATNPLFLAVYQGVDRSGRATGGPAYRLDFPRSAGSCAACHVPAAALAAPFGADPLRAAGVAADGISCDLCHKVREVALDDTGGRPGVLSLRLARPAPGKDVFFGQLDDVTAGPDAFAALYRESAYCAPCHHGAFWGLRAYSEFSEWAASSYARRKVHCQDCHMRPDPGPRRLAAEKEGALLRDGATLSSHRQYGVDDEAFMRQAVVLRARAQARGDRIRVSVSVRNAGAGHHLPTGSPMRNMVLLVEARDARGRALALAEGGRVPDWAGRGSPWSGDYAGLPGKGFAKVLAELVEYPADRRQGRRFARASPAPYWRPAAVVSDTRIPAEATDESEYLFARAGSDAPVTVEARLVYRRTFRSWGSLDRIKGGELELAKASAAVAW